MKPYPHQYAASASARAADIVMIHAPDLPSIETAAPPEFGGPGDAWSPEMLLCAAVADCFILTFRALARAAHFEWFSLDCRVKGVLEHVRDTIQFTRFTTEVRLTLPPGAEHAKARLLLGRSEHGCLIANSLRGERMLSVQVMTMETDSDLPGAPQVSAHETPKQRAAPSGPHVEGRQLP